MDQTVGTADQPEIITRNLDEGREGGAVRLAAHRAVAVLHHAGLTANLVTHIAAQTAAFNHGIRLPESPGAGTPLAAR